MTIDLDQKYGEAYGNDLTPREVYAFIEQCLQERGIDQDYIWERPYTFSLVYGQHKKSGEVLVPPVYYMALAAGAGFAHHGTCGFCVSTEY